MIESGWINAGSSVTRSSLVWRVLWITKACNRNRRTLPAVAAANYLQPCWNICSVLFHKLTAPPVTFYQNARAHTEFYLTTPTVMMMIYIIIIMQMAPSRTSWSQQQVFWSDVLSRKPTHQLRSRKVLPVFWTSTSAGTLDVQKMLYRNNTENIAFSATHCVLCQG